MSKFRLISDDRVREPENTISMLNIVKADPSDLRRFVTGTSRDGSKAARKTP